MDWINDSIVDFVTTVYNGLFMNIKELYDLAIITPAAYNGDLWALVVNFNKIAVLPVAWTLTALFLTIELLNIIQRADAKGLEVIKLICNLMIKILLALFCMQNMTAIIEMIFEIVSSIVNNGSGLFKVANRPIESTTISDALENESALVLLGLWVQCLIIQLGSNICFVLAKLVTQLRYIEIYVFIAVAALPFATLVSKEYGKIGEAYLKRLSGLALQVIFIVVVIYIYSILIRSEVFVVENNNVTTSMWNMVGYSILLVIALFQTGGWSKSLTQAN